MTITQRRVRELLHYNPWTGAFTWRPRGNARWDGRYAGRKAGGKDKYGYVTIGVDGRPTYFAHRLAWLYIYGWIPVEVDHENHIRDDNRIANLSAADRASNTRNQSLSKANTSGRTGVYWHKLTGQWRARIKVRGKYISLGLYDDISDAAAARLSAEREFGFHGNHGAANDNDYVKVVA